MQGCSRKTKIVPYAQAEKTDYTACDELRPSFKRQRPQTSSAKRNLFLKGPQLRKF